MQIMPATAAFLTNDRKMRTSKRHLLYDPAFNIELGQRYISHLFDEPYIADNLERMLAAYNAGPGNLNKWLKKINHDDDALLFIESIPARETRLYVKSVVANLWMYRTQLGQDTPAVRHIATQSNSNRSLAYLFDSRLK